MQGRTDCRIQQRAFFYGKRLEQRQDVLLLQGESHGTYQERQRGRVQQQELHPVLCGYGCAFA